MAYKDKEKDIEYQKNYREVRYEIKLLKDIEETEQRLEEVQKQIQRINEKTI